MWNLLSKIKGYYLSKIAKHNQLFYITDKAAWALDGVANGLSKELARQYGLHANIINTVPLVSKQIIHFVSRDALFGRKLPTAFFGQNIVFLNWYHWDTTDLSPSTLRNIQSLKNIQNQLKGIITSCSSSKNDLVNAGINSASIRIIPLAIDLDYFRPSSAELKKKAREHLGIPQDSICIGSFQKDGCGWGDGNEPKLIKGPDTFLKTIKILSQKYRKQLFVLLTGPARGYVKQGLKEIGVSFTHHFIDDYRKVVNYYNALDLYIVASRTEGGPLAFLESRACGIPVISTNMGMPKDIVKHMETGLLASIDSPEELAKNAILILENIDLRERFTTAGLAEANNYSWGEIAKNHYENLYKANLF